ncbi:hypothetical protein F6W69_03145 [Microbacterium oxydans]|uniref:hypothetical protein n=3 Tax=Microbacterium TaxID=33882 RepID=UPI001141666D|nr:hypothetical protein [Microbacterium oxydans]KAB1893060.1 hypothetical protein F6W69_03145 [Microbacterium oxydans]
MSEPQRPSGPPAPHLPASPQYPTTSQNPAAPQNPSPQYPAPQHPAPQYPAAPQYPPAPLPSYGAPQHPADTGNPLGRVAFLIAVIAFAVNLVISLTAPFAYFAADGYGWYNALSGLVGVVSLVAYVLAFILGLVAVRRPGPHLLAGIAIGIAGVGAIGMATTWMSSLFYQFF